MILTCSFLSEHRDDFYQYEVCQQRESVHRMMSSPKLFRREKIAHTDSIQSNVRGDRIDPIDIDIIF